MKTQAEPRALDLSEKFNHLWHLVGNTPMLEIFYTLEGISRSIFVKCEHYNLTGSIKDRMALYILDQAYRQGKINPSDTIVEATSGNTGIAFSALGKALGHSVRIIMPNWLSRERIDIIQSLGADITLVSKEEGGFLGSIRLSEELAAQGGVFLPQQFENQYNAEAHERTTGPEIWRQLDLINKKPDAFV
ncbi:PLP-dependent cysteine synthase family protein, partial [Siphonobacter sp. SORGH_AS_1065]|uniref:PLP-dependent cysteine synthase family protein n=1 Tax=Siphonobacter sp. SORGH_AS_1065 TaxID=3041795 RepID=UPI00278A77EC